MLVVAVGGGSLSLYRGRGSSVEVILTLRLSYTELKVSSLHFQGVWCVCVGPFSRIGIRKVHKLNYHRALISQLAVILSFLSVSGQRPYVDHGLSTAHAECADEVCITC